MYIDSVFHTPDTTELESPLYLTWAGHRICSKDHVIGPRVLPNYKIVMVVNGSGFFRLRGENRLIRTGDLFFCFPDVIHHYFANERDPWTIKWVSFNGRNCRSLMESLAITPEEPIMTDCMTTELFTLMEQLLEGLKRDNEHAYAATGCVYLFFDKLMQIRSNERTECHKRISQQELAEKIKRFVFLNYANSLSVDIIANHLNYSRSFISHFFKQQSGISLPQYINEVRIQRAKVLLRNTDMSNEEIALSIGYSDASYFSKSFKRITGVSPQKYRNGSEKPDQ